jgi:hypothetical protein
MMKMEAEMTALREAVNLKLPVQEGSSGPGSSSGSNGSSGPSVALQAVNGGGEAHGGRSLLAE